MLDVYEIDKSKNNMKLKTTLNNISSYTESRQLFYIQGADIRLGFRIEFHKQIEKCVKFFTGRSWRADVWII